MLGWLKAHWAYIAATVGPVAVAAIRHYWPQLSAFVTGPGTDKVVMASLVAFTNLLKKAGANDEEIKIIEGVASQVALRVAQDIQQSLQAPKA
jgi:hypothetical protein